MIQLWYSLSWFVVILTFIISCDSHYHDSLWWSIATLKWWFIVMADWAPLLPCAHYPMSGNVYPSSSAGLCWVQSVCPLGFSPCRPSGMAVFQSVLLPLGAQRLMAPQGPKGKARQVILSAISSSMESLSRKHDHDYSLIGTSRLEMS